MPPDDVPMAASLPSSENDVPHRVGPFDVRRDIDTLTLRLADRGELSFNGCLLLACLTIFVMAIGVVALIEAATAPPPLLHHSLSTGNSPTRLLEPPQNHFGILWAISIVCLVLGVPIAVRKAYHSALVYTFRRSDDLFLRGSYRVTRLRKIEQVVLRETLDPDERYVYHLDIIYGDGREIELHCGYNERELMNLANEIASFVEVSVVWK